MLLRIHSSIRCTGDQQQLGKMVPSNCPSVTVCLNGSRFQSLQKRVGNGSPHHPDEDWRLGTLWRPELGARSGLERSTLCS